MSYRVRWLDLGTGRGIVNLIVDRQMQQHLEFTVVSLPRLLPTCEHFSTFLNGVLLGRVCIPASAARRVTNDTLG